MPLRVSCELQVGRKELELVLGGKDLVLMTYWVALDQSQPEYNFHHRERDYLSIFAIQYM